MTTSTTSTAAVDPKAFKTFAGFYPFYLSEHSTAPAAACTSSARRWP